MKPSLVNANSPTSLCRQVHSILSKEIAEGKYRPGERFPSERALAERFAVSRASIREAVTQLLAEGFLFRTVGRGTFVSEPGSGKPHAAAAGAHVGFWISARVFNFVQPGYNQILTGAGEVCRERGYHLGLRVVDQNFDAALNEELAMGSPAGHLVVGGVESGLLDRLRQLDQPLLAVDLLVGDARLSSIRIDYADGTLQAVRHLKALGHREIGFIGFPESEKYEAFWRSLEECGLPYLPRCVQFLSVWNLAPGMLVGFQAMQRLLAAGPPPSALLVTNDYVAMGVMEALAIAGMPVPDSVSVVGFDDLGVTAQPLTTVKVDLVEVGRKAAAILLHQIETGVKPAGQVLAPVELVVRSTTAPPRTAALQEA